MLERRRIEAKLLAHVYATLCDTHGAETAERIVGESVRRAAVEQGAEMAAALDGRTSLETFIAAQELWTRGGALAVEIEEASSERFAFKVTRCEYARMYR
jgi:hypothetical protein